MFIKILPLISVFSLLFVTCTKTKIPPCESPLSIFDANISFVLKDNAGTQLVGDFGRTYESNLVKLLNSDSSEFTNFKVRGDGLISINPSESSDSVGQKLSKSFLVILPVTSTNPFEDTDTLDIKYNILYSACSTLWYDSVKVSYNQISAYSGNYPYDNITITKKN